MVWERPSPEDNLGLVYDQVKKFFPRWKGEREELVELFMEALVVACVKFNPDKGFQFSSYAVRVMHNFFSTEMERKYRSKEIAILDLVPQVESETEAFDYLVGQLGLYTELELGEDEKSWNTRTHLQRQIMTTDQQSPTRRSIAEEVGCSPQYVGKTLRKNLLKGC